MSWLGKRSVGVFLAPTIYLALCVAVGLRIVPSEGSWGWFLPFLAAFPFSLALLPLTNVIGPFLTFGIFGTLWWLLLSKVIGFIITRIAARIGRAR
jgi:hypothetical protein